MLIQFGKFTLVLLFLFFITNNEAYSSTCCEQTFTIHVKTPGTHSILIYKELLDGECYYTANLFLLLLEPDTVVVLKTSFWQDPDNECVIPHFKDMNHENHDIITNSDGSFYLNDSMHVRTPKFDSTFSSRFLKIGAAAPNIWYRECLQDCLDEPNFNFKADLVYYHKRGVYKNYNIKNIYYYEKSGYLIIETENPMKAAGLDTMHGLLIYKVHIE